MRHKTFRPAALLTLLLLSASYGGRAMAAEIVVMTWNVHGGNPPATPGNQNCDFYPKDADLDHVRRWLDAYGVDVAVLQEIHRFQAEAMERALRYRDPRYRAYFFSNKICKPANRGLDYGSAFITRLPIVAGTIFQKNFNHQVPQFTQRPEFASLDGFTVQFGGQRVRVYNAHPSEREPYRQKQLGELRSLIYPANVSTTAERPRTILLGDFNTPYDPRPGTAYASMSGLFLDSWLATHPARPQDGVTAPARGLRLDYIFLGDRRLQQPGVQTGFRILFSRVLQTGNASDHLPVVTRLALN